MANKGQTRSKIRFRTTVFGTPRKAFEFVKTCPTCKHFKSPLDPCGPLCRLEVLFLHSLVGQKVRGLVAPTNPPHGLCALYLLMWRSICPCRPKIEFSCDFYAGSSAALRVVYVLLFSASIRDLEHRFLVPSSCFLPFRFSVSQVLR